MVLKQKQGEDPNQPNKIESSASHAKTSPHENKVPCALSSSLSSTTQATKRSTPTNHSRPPKPMTRPLITAREPESKARKPAGATAMRLIVPLQGVVQGRGGLILGSLIPCALFYFFQLYAKRHRSPKSDSNPVSPSQSSPNLAELNRSSSRSNLSSRGSIGRVQVSSRTSSIAKPNDSPYYIGLDKVSEDPFDRFDNPNGIIQLGLSENRVSFCFGLLVLSFIGSSVLIACFSFAM